MKVYKELTIDAAHRLPHYAGPCERVHGHTYRIEVWIDGEVLRDDGILVDFGSIKEGFSTYDHTMLNEVAPFDRIPPTAENMAAHFAERILNENMGRGARRVTVRIWETPTSYAEGTCLSG